MIKIADGLGAETRVEGELLRTAPSIITRVLYHDWVPRYSEIGPDHMAEFASLSGADVVRMNFGWQEWATPRKSKLLSRPLQLLRFLVATTRGIGIGLRFRPDLVYSSQQKWDLHAATIIAKATRTPQVIHLHYICGPWLGRLPLRRLQGCSAVIAISRFVGDSATASGVPADRVHIVPNALSNVPPYLLQERLSARSEWGFDDNHFVVGMVAHVRPGKGHADALAAFRAAVAINPNLRLVMVGTGPLRNQLQAATADLFPHVQWMGNVTNVWKSLAGFDMFLHPSLNEGFGLAVLEAMFAGLPVVAYRSGATPEVVSDGESGLLAEPGDVSGLADRIVLLSENPEFAKSAGIRGRQLAEAHNTVEAQSKVFASVLECVALGSGHGVDSDPT